MISRIPNKLLKNLDINSKDVDYVIKFSFTRSAISAISVMIIVQYIFTFLYSLDLLFAGEIMFKYVFQSYSALMLLVIICWSIFPIQWNKYFIFTTSRVHKVKYPFLFRLFPNLFNIFNVCYDDIIGLKVKKPYFIHINMNKRVNATKIGGVKYNTMKELIIQLERKHRSIFDEIVNSICEKAALERDPTQKYIYIKKLI
ncbi:MAG: hypothetical protein ACTSP9_19290 [Promethearchaeota archaeon]